MKNMGSPSCFMEKKFVKGQKGDDITPFDGTDLAGSDPTKAFFGH
jgi:hypothetical protein